MGKKFTLDWYRELGWRDNPFKEGLKEPVSDFYCGYETERSKLNYWTIENYKFGKIKGPKGIGKTSMLHWFRAQLDSHSMTVPVLIDKKRISKQEFWARLIKAALPKSDRLLKRSYYGLKLDKAVHWFKKKLHMTDNPNPEENIYKKIFAKHFSSIDELELIAFLRNHMGDKRLVLLIDDASDFPPQLIDVIGSLFDAELPLQVLIADVEFADHWKILNQEDKLHLKLKGMNYEDSREMIKRRIEAVRGVNIRPFTAHYLMEIVKNSEKNPKSIIHACYELAVKVALRQIKLVEDRPKRQVKHEHVKSHSDVKPSHDSSNIVEEDSPADELDVFEELNKDLIKSLKEEEMTKPKQSNKSSEGNYKINIVDQGSEEIVMDAKVKKVKVTKSKPKKKHSKKKTVKKKIIKKARRSKSS